MVASDVAWTCCQECAAQGNWRQAGAEGRKTFRRNSARRQKIALWATFEENPKETSMKYVRIVVVAVAVAGLSACATNDPNQRAKTGAVRSEEHTSELQSLMRISYAVFCLTKKT